MNDILSASGILAYKGRLWPLKLPWPYLVMDLTAWMLAWRAKLEDEMTSITSADLDAKVYLDELAAINDWLKDKSRIDGIDPHLALRQQVFESRVDHGNIDEYIKCLLARSSPLLEPPVSCDFFFAVDRGRSDLYTTDRIVARHSGPAVLGTYVSQDKLDTMIGITILGYAPTFLR